MIVQQHWFREQRPLVRSMIGFVVIATVLCLLLGPVGILYAVGLEVLYLFDGCLRSAFGPGRILEPFPFRWNRNGALDSRFDAFS